jgi:hypothetical protein
VDDLRELVLPIFPIYPLAVMDKPLQSDRILSYMADLEIEFPEVLQHVAEVCGPPPWIIRSAGTEDELGHVNAGGYDSLICDEPGTLIRCIATVALSGLTEHAQRQEKLNGEERCTDAISCFVQPLLNIHVDSNVGLTQSPYFDSAVLDRLEVIGRDLIKIFGFDAIDCEWGLETTIGFVSVTTVMPKDLKKMNVSHTMGFGFATAQSTGSSATSMCLRPASSSLRLWRGEFLRETTVNRIYLLQARPAYFDYAFREYAALTDDCRKALNERYEFVTARLLMLGAHSSGNALIAPNLMNAWRRYLALHTEEQVKLAIVLVGEGSAEEHAGIMFRHQCLTCVKIDISKIPVANNCVIFDQGVCIFGDSAMLRGVSSESRQELLIPDDCMLLFNGEVLTASGDLTKKTANELSELYQLPVSSEVKKCLSSRTEQPVSNSWLQTAAGTVQSPSLLAAIWRSEHLTAYADYFTVTEFGSMYKSAVELPFTPAPRKLCFLDASSAPVQRLLSDGDVRVALALLFLDKMKSFVSSDTLSRLIGLADAELTAGSRERSLIILESVEFANRECEILPFYDREDIVNYLSALVTDLEAGMPVDILRSIRLFGLPIINETLLRQLVLRRPAAVHSLNLFRSRLSEFVSLGVGDDETMQVSRSLNEAYTKLRDILLDAELPGVAELIKCSLVEVYDASLKRFLSATVEHHEVRYYDRYLLLMRCWIELLDIESVVQRDKNVFKVFTAWLHSWSNAPMPASFDLLDRNWEFEFNSISTGAVRPQRYENPHVVHNLLHQYALAQLQFDSALLPRRVVVFENFCSTFSSRMGKVLRFERDLLEIQIPMGTHKASYLFTSRLVYVEWSEPPDCSGKEIARILAFEVLLDRFRDWMFPSLKFWREEILGTWTLFIRIERQEMGEREYYNIKRFVIATRFIFDASYDFSYVDNGIINGFREHFYGEDWNEIIKTLIKYRSTVADADQYVALHSLPLSSAIATIARSGLIRGLLLRCRRYGFSYCLQAVDGYVRWLDAGAADSRKWPERYEALRQASLCLAATWPKESLSILAERKVYHVGDDLIAACLLKRSDLSDEFKGVSASLPLRFIGIQGMFLRHAPELMIFKYGVLPIARHLVDCDSPFRRAKHLIVSHYGSCLHPKILKGLVQNLDAVPWGRVEKDEHAILSVLPKGIHVYRFDLRKGVDWATLDSWRIAPQPAPLFPGNSSTS